MYDDYGDEDTMRRRQQQPDLYAPVAPTDSGPASSGQAPAPPAPRYDYNAGSPPDQKLTQGHGWEWEGPTEQAWNPELNQWDRGVWQERSGKGLGYTAPTTTPPPPPRFADPVTPSSYTPPGNTSYTPAPQGPAYKTPPITDEVTKILMARLNELKNPGDLNSDPNYQSAVRAYQLQSLRGADKQRKALAERSAASGTRASGGFNVGVRGIQERQGENAAQYTSGLALDRLTQRETQLTQAIQMARSVGQDDIANQLEAERLKLQGELGRGDLALRGELGRGQLGLGEDQLGFSYADLIQRMNRDATLAVLNGGG